MKHERSPPTSVSAAKAEHRLTANQGHDLQRLERASDREILRSLFCARQRDPLKYI